MPETCQAVSDLLDEPRLTGSCPDCYAEGVSTAESAFFSEGHSNQLMFLMI